MRRHYKPKSNTVRDILILLAGGVPAVMWAAAYGQILAGY